MVLMLSVVSYGVVLPHYLRYFSRWELTKCAGSIFCNFAAYGFVIAGLLFTGNQLTIYEPLR